MADPTAASRLPLGKSKYTYRQLNQLLKYSVDTPLRVTAHIDLDAFYAQCEMKRLRTDENAPLAVQQWQNLIAVNYPAREFNVSRHITATEALKLCPDLILVHVATWQAGDTHWAYRDNPSVASCKACLDPYRAESKKIVSIFRAACPRVEKASIDESFLDLSVMIHERLVERYPVLALPPPYNDPTENLPLPPQDVEVEWVGSHLLELDEGWEGALDWNDVAMGIAAEIVDEVRGSVRRELGYTCSAGIAQNKMLAKLGSEFKKPNQQTVVRLGAAQKFLNTFKFTKLRNLGGKLGTQISEQFNTTELSTLLSTPLSQLQSRLDDDTATWVYNIIRGVDRSEVNPRTQIQSMLSAKSFRPYINSTDAATKWLTIFVSDIHSRLEEEGVMEGKRRPKTMTLSHKAVGGAGKARSAQIREVSSDALMALAVGLLRGVEEQGRAWPCALLSLQVSGFEEREVGNLGIRGFLVSAEASKGAGARKVKGEEAGPAAGREFKRRRVDEDIGRFFRRVEPIDETSLEGDELPQALRGNQDSPDTRGETPSSDINIPATDTDRPTFACPRCSALLPFEQQEEHGDWHFAKDLANEERAQALRERSTAPITTTSTPPAKAIRGGMKRGGEKGQRPLAFGKRSPYGI